MVNLFGVIKTQFVFFIGFIMVYMFGYLLPVFENVTFSMFDTTGLSQMMWFFAIIIYVLALIIIPSITMIRALQEPDNLDKATLIIIGILLFILNLYLSYKAYFVVQGMAGLLDTGLVLTIFWIGAVIQWLLSTLIAPASIILQGRSNG